MTIYKNTKASSVSCSSKGQWNNVLQGESGFQYFRVDPPHPTKSGGWKSGYFRGERRPIDYDHVNVNFPNPMSELETKLKANYNHYPLSDQAYNLLNNMDHSAQMVQIAGKAFLITGIVSDIMRSLRRIYMMRTENWVRQQAMQSQKWMDAGQVPSLAAPLALSMER